jgi:MOSC domain-containing protein YiiM
VRLVSVQIGKTRMLSNGGSHTRTGIFKNPVLGPVATYRDGLEGDRIGNKQLHGGKYKAVYSYALEHYPFWSLELERSDLSFGYFGENLVTEGLMERDVFSGDVFRIGTAELMATTPRMPCGTLARRLEQPDMVARFVDAERPGIYFAVTKQGSFEAGDFIEKASSASGSLTIVQLMRMYVGRETDPAVYKLGSELESIPEEWRERFGRKRLGP